MEIETRRTVSFPVVVRFVPETGEIQLQRPTELGFRIRVSRDPASASGHPQLYKALGRALRESGGGLAEPPATFN